VDDALELAKIEAAPGQPGAPEREPRP
jgi:hypothetical protein